MKFQIVVLGAMICGQAAYAADVTIANQASPNRAQATAAANVGPWEFEQIPPPTRNFDMWMVNTQTGVVYMCSSVSSDPKSGDIKCIKAQFDAPPGQ